MSAVRWKRLMLNRCKWRYSIWQRCSSQRLSQRPVPYRAFTLIGSVVPSLRCAVGLVICDSDPFMGTGAHGWKAALPACVKARLGDEFCSTPEGLWCMERRLTRMHSNPSRPARPWWADFTDVGITDVGLAHLARARGLKALREQERVASGPGAFAATKSLSRSDDVVMSRR